MASAPSAPASPPLPPAEPPPPPAESPPPPSAALDAADTAAAAGSSPGAGRRGRRRRRHGDGDPVAAAGVEGGRPGRRARRRKASADTAQSAFRPNMTDDGEPAPTAPDKPAGASLAGAGQSPTRPAANPSLIQIPSADDAAVRSLRAHICSLE